MTFHAPTSKRTLIITARTPRALSRHFHEIEIPDGIDAQAAAENAYSDFIGEFFQLHIRETKRHGAEVLGPHDEEDIIDGWENPWHYPQEPELLKRDLDEILEVLDSDDSHSPASLIPIAENFLAALRQKAAEWDALDPSER